MNAVAGDTHGVQLQLHLGSREALARFEQVLKAVVGTGNHAVFDVAHLQGHAQVRAGVVEATQRFAAFCQKDRSAFELAFGDAALGNI